MFKTECKFYYQKGAVKECIALETWYKNKSCEGCPFYKPKEVNVKCYTL